MKNNKKILALILTSALFVATIVGVIIVKTKKKDSPVVPDNTATKATYSSLFDTLDKKSFYFAASYVKTEYLSDNSYDSKENISSIFESRIKPNLYSFKTSDGTFYIFDKNLEKNATVIPSLSITKNNAFFNFNINYASAGALNIFGVNAKSGTNNGFYALNTNFNQNFYISSSKIDTTLLYFTKNEVSSFKNSAFLKSILLNQPTAKLEIELLSDNKNYVFTVDENIKQISQEMAWMVKNYDILKNSLSLISP